MEGVDVPISAATGIIPAEGLIATPGAIDSHVHLISRSSSPSRSPAA